MAAILPPLGFLATDEPEVRLMDQCGRLERLPGLFLSEPQLGNPSELTVDERQEFLGRARVATLDGREEA
jgi:hypothetical protein